MKHATVKNSNPISAAQLPAGCPSFPSDALFPINRFTEFVKGMLLLDRHLSEVVALRFLGATYKEIGERQGISIQLAEMRHKSALRQWPEFEAFFPEKVARRDRRRSRQ